MIARLGAALGILVAAMTAAVGEEVRVPEFDHGEIEASYVIALPPGYDAERDWPLILDFHGAIAPTRKGASITHAAVWSEFVKSVPCIVVGLNGRTRSWGTIKSGKDDRAFALHVLASVRERYSIDPERIYLAGFSSGSDYLCSGGLQSEGLFAGSLVVCPGPPNVVGLRGGELLEAKDHPFLFATGEADYVRKSGAWEAHLALEGAGGRTRYREVAGRAHEFFGIEEYAALFASLEELSGNAPAPSLLTGVRGALDRDDLLLASTRLAKSRSTTAGRLLTAIAMRGQRLVRRAEAVDDAKEPGRAYEAWWHVLTQFHRFPRLAARASEEIAALEGAHPRRDLYRDRGAWFRRGPRTPGDGSAEEADEWRFDRYLDHDEVTARLTDLAERFPNRARLVRIGKSIEGRDILLLEVTNRASGPPDAKPAVYIQGGIHGNETATVMTVLYAAWQLAANPGKSRGTERLLANTTFYLVPAVNPDAVHHYLTEPHSHWRPRFNYRPNDADGDGKMDEDPYEDLDGDGEIGLMYAPDEVGPFVLKDGRLVRGEGTPRYRLVGREGIDDDEDGKFSEDRPGGVDLNRNFPVGFTARRRFEGSSGSGPASEPETRAVIDFVTAHENIALFLDLHGNANCLFYWLGPDDTADSALYDAATGRVSAALGYTPRALRHPGAGLAIAWAYGERGIPSLLLELESVRGRSKEDYYETAWGGEVFMPAVPFEHPQLGPVLIGNDDRKIPRRNLHPSDIFWQADRTWEWLKAEAGQLGRLSLIDPVVSVTDDGFAVRGEIAVSGNTPLDTERARLLGNSTPIEFAAEGATIRGSDGLEPPAPGAAVPFEIRLTKCAESVTLRITHPRGGSATLPVVRPRSASRPIRREYSIEKGYATPDTARRADNGHYVKGVSAKERGPAFTVTHKKPVIRLAVLLGEWSDRRHVIATEEFERAFFSRGSNHGRSTTGQHVYGSVRDFYEEMSYGRVEVEGTVFDWIELPGDHAEYRDASFGSRMLSTRMIEAVLARDGPDALDGYDGLAFVWAGNAIRRTSMLWPMRLTLKDRSGVVAFKMSEIYRGEAAPIGVPCHELAHTFGVNDKYGLGASKNPLGPWCLIGKGTHGGKPSSRHRPFHLCAWCKLVIGWLRPTVVDPGTPQKLALRPVLHGPGEAYRILLRPDGSEYLLLENRRREGFFTDLPSPGLAILEVGPNDKPSAPQARVELLPAHGLPPAARSDPARPEEIAWPQEGRNEITIEGVRISAIRLVDDVVYFEVGPAGR